ncbi:hypothetical protein LOZ53_002015 [Ophidiomyces ophidiicola]|uniref:uncharacterized protein n=1 Tax=Ophidiomyces ophidiicola TaxID=1387563 RepID=UPI0020C35542|nr:uncharacterized protein LOZ57_003289 [Ophidiomyces ophidiicola]KAI1914141.1 hypothetical protein LOZ61_002317 [Ophidiomyces ophidiicola]KAI1915831.1 hypothetical protein LOZ64_003471 [Ophidiomyces ophidiicola]KAI1926613.1 hypothetical protein LOZ60_003537 [Ophidiomyces ophidiicola]KAI1947558.1 hypothetical protein LOZ57_003289 [Ophidiomyces ophidiicola]KAI1963725.1 hypothetical protein LOZ59_001648 [Ophidiomyces ophidiicola]
MAGFESSPLSSPRLPSPPPFPEVQIEPKSSTTDESLIGVLPAQDGDSTRRIRPGTKAVDMASGPPLIPLSQLESPFQLQEHLKASYQSYTQPPGSSTIIPISHSIARQLAEPPEGIERSLWLYELCRFLTMKVNNIIIAFFAENPPCSAQTCPEMRASEWQYLCAVHEPPRPCCAIDYSCHTLDWATNILTSPKLFPSRLTLGTEASGGPQAGMKHLTNIFRRLYRIFAHAWFQHRDVFWQVEGHDGLYVFFKTVCDMYDLLPLDNYTIPPEAEGEERRLNKPEEGDRRVMLLRKEDLSRPDSILDSSSLSTGAATRRHRHTPSTGAAVSTIVETAEDEEVSKKTDSSPTTVLKSEPSEQRQLEGQLDTDNTDNWPSSSPSSSSPSSSSSPQLLSRSDILTELPLRLKHQGHEELAKTSPEIQTTNTNSDSKLTSKEGCEKEQQQMSDPAIQPPLEQGSTSTSETESAITPEAAAEDETKPSQAHEPEYQVHDESSKGPSDSATTEKKLQDGPKEELQAEEAKESSTDEKKTSQPNIEAKSQSRPPPEDKDEIDKEGKA